MESEKLAKVVGRHWDIISLLYERMRYTSELSETLGKGLPAISKAMKDLDDAGLVEIERSPNVQKKGGVRRYYRLTERGRIIFEAIAYAKRIPERRVYSKEELEMLVEHSRVLKHSIIHLLRGSRTYKRYTVSGRGEYDSDVALRNMPYLLSHLKTGYPEVHRLIEERDGLRRRREELEAHIREKVRMKAPEKFKDALSPEGRIVDLITERSRALLTGSVSRADTDENWRVESDGVWCGGLKILSSSGQVSLEEVKSLVIKVSEQILEDYGEIIELEHKFYERDKALKEKLEYLLSLVENGVPLEGYCKICEAMPRIRSR